MHASDDSASYGAARCILGRWLHFGMALCICLCLVLSLAFDPAHAPLGGGELVAFNLHKFIGLNGLLLLALYLMWVALGHGKRWEELFPWWSMRQLRAVAQELRHPAGWLRMRAVPAMVQGVGVACAVLAFASGACLLACAFDKALQHHPWMSAARQLHLWSSRLLWAYLAVHVGAVLLHACVGLSPHMRAMFRLLDPQPAGDTPPAEVGPDAGWSNGGGVDGLGAPQTAD